MLTLSTCCYSWALRSSGHFIALCLKDEIQHLLKVYHTFGLDFCRYSAEKCFSSNEALRAWLNFLMKLRVWFFLNVHVVKQEHFFEISWFLWKLLWISVSLCSTNTWCEFFQGPWIWTALLCWSPFHSTAGRELPASSLPCSSPRGCRVLGTQRKNKVFQIFFAVQAEAWQP